MENFNYSVIITSEGERFTYETNDVRKAIAASFECADDASHICICNGFTGEVLFHNGDEPYCTDEMGLMMLGFLMEQNWGEDDEPQDEEEVCPMCGGEVEDGVCQYCGICVECDHDDPTAEELISAIVAKIATEFGLSMPS